MTPDVAAVAPISMPTPESEPAPAPLQTIGERTRAIVEVAEGLRRRADRFWQRHREIMTRANYVPGSIHALLIALISVSPAFGQHGRGYPGMMGDSAHAADMQVFHQLFDHRTEIKRQVLLRQDGVETVTESTNPEVTQLLQTHVASMLARVKDKRPIHRRDPLFAELFRYADRMEARYELAAGGVRVVETSQDPYVVKLLQAHAEVVSAFIANGRSEMMKNHPLPPRQ